MNKPTKDQVWEVHGFIETLTVLDYGTPDDLECVSDSDASEIKDTLKKLSDLGVSSSDLSDAAEVLELLAEVL